MIYVKKDKNDNSISYLRIKKEDLYEKHQLIKKGTRGKIFNFQNDFALKNFNEERIELLRIRKELIKRLMQLKDDSFCFPIGFLEYSCEELRGYYMDYLNENYITLALSSVEERTLIERIQRIQKISTAIERIHKKGIIIGDLHNQNIMIDREGNPKFVDTDSYGYDDILPEENLFCIRLYQEECGKDKPLTDCDKYWLGVLALEYLFPEIDIPNYPEELREFIKKCKIPKQVKESFNIIFSDAINKPYVGTLLAKLNPEKEIIKSRKRKM